MFSPTLQSMPIAPTLATGIAVLGVATLIALLRQRRHTAARSAVLTNARYREMAEAMPHIVWTARPDGTVDYYNRHWRAYTGLSNEETLGAPWGTGLHPEELTVARELWAKALAEGTPFEVDDRIRRAADGELRWHLVRAVPVRDADGRITAWFGTCNDIHEPKRAQANLLDQQVTLEHRIVVHEAEAERATALYQLLAENATDMVSTHVPAGAFDYATPSWMEYVGTDVVGLAPIDFCHPDDVELLMTNYKLGFSSTDLIRTVWRCRRPDGSYGSLETHTRPVHDPVTKRVATFVCATHDVSERVRREQEFELLHAIVLEVSGAATLDDAIDVTLRQLCTATGWSYGEAWIPSADGVRLERSSTWYALDGTDVTLLARECEGLTVQRDEGITGLAWASGEVIWARDIATDPRTRDVAPASAVGFTAGIAVPVTMEGVVVAVLVFMMPAASPGDASRIAFVSVVAERLSVLVARKRDEAALRQSEEKYRQLVEQAADAILLIDADGRCAEANTRAGLLLGKSPFELIGRPLSSFMSSDLAGQEPMPAVHGTEVLTAEGWVRHADGTSVPVEASAALLPDQRTQIIARDISSRKELERLKDEFLSVVSHELRTPLTSIRGSLGLLASGTLTGTPAKGQRMLDVAVANTDRLIRLINDILDVERINSGAVPMEPDWCDGIELARSVADALRPMADRAGVALRVDGSAVRVWADPDRITQTLTNLVGNAIKFSPGGSSVDVTVSEADDAALFEVRDRGRGIPPDKLEMIFGRFQQVDASDSREKGGTGLGLAISRGIVGQHGGRIWAENAPDGGSIFKFSLPLRDDHALHDRIVAPPARVTRILVIEDDLELAHVIETALESNGFEVDVAHTGAAAIARHHLSSADVLIVDLALPDMNGLDLLEEIRRSQRSPNAPAIIYTASDPNAAARDRIRGMGAQFATKSRVSTDALVARVLQLLGLPANGAGMEPRRAAS